MVRRLKNSINPQAHLILNFYVHHDGQQLGPFSLEELRAQSDAGSFQSTDLAWQEGTPDWQPLSAVLGLAGGTPPPIPVPGSPFPAAVPQTSGLAIASLVLGILSFFTAGLTGIAAVICGHLATGRIKRSNGRLVGRGIAIAGLVTGYLGFVLIFLGILAGIALPVFNSIQVRGKAVKGLAQAKQIALGCKLYAGDHNGNYPETLDQLIPDYVSDRRIFVCPLSADQTSVGYKYYGGTEAYPASKVLLENKDAWKQHFHIVVHMDASGEITRE